MAKKAIGDNSCTPLLGSSQMFFKRVAGRLATESHTLPDGPEGLTFAISWNQAFFCAGRTYPNLLYTLSQSGRLPGVPFTIHSQNML